jgi:hypothetical protein
MLITDTVTLADARVNADGYLEAVARTARTGVQQYRGAEVGKPEIAVVNVFRDEAAVFSKASLDSFAQIPITVDHPPEAVNAGNWKQYAAGTTGAEVLRDGEHLKIGLRITDKAAVDAVQAGKRELSVGYTTQLVWGDGVAPDGTAYQAKQTNIVANHIAIVAAGRAGHQCRIGDSWAAISDHQEPPMKTFVVDGISVEMSDTAIQVVQKVLDQFGAAKTALTDANTKVGELTATISAKDGEIVVLKQQVTDAALTPEKLDAAVQARGAVIADAKAIHKDVVTDGKTDAEIKRAAVVAKLGDAATGMDDAAIGGAFAALCKATPRDTVRDALTGGLKVVDRNAPVAAYDAMVASLQGAWNTQKGAA